MGMAVRVVSFVGLRADDLASALRGLAAFGATPGATGRAFIATFADFFDVLSAMVFTPSNDGGKTYRREKPVAMTGAVPESDAAGAGMRRHVQSGNPAAESFVSVIPLFDDVSMGAIPFQPFRSEPF